MIDNRALAAAAAAAFVLIVRVSSGLGGVSASESSARPGPTPGSEGSPSPALPAAAAFGQPFTLELGETAVVEGGLIVVFTSVVGDSRCPTDVQCVWEGNAEITITIVTPGEPAASLDLNTNPGFATVATYLATSIALIDLDPYPTTSTLPSDAYRATLVADSSDGDIAPPLTSAAP